MYSVYSVYSVYREKSVYNVKYNVMYRIACVICMCYMHVLDAICHRTLASEAVLLLYVPHLRTYFSLLQADRLSPVTLLLSFVFAVHESSLYKEK